MSEDRGEFTQFRYSLNTRVRARVMTSTRGHRTLELGEGADVADVLLHLRRHAPAGSPRSGAAPAHLRSACARLAACCGRHSTRWVWEQPRPSIMWRTRWWRAAFANGPQFVALLGWCRYCRPWRKTTCFKGALWVAPASLHALRICLRR